MMGFLIGLLIYAFGFFTGIYVAVYTMLHIIRNHSEHGTLFVDKYRITDTFQKLG